MEEYNDELHRFILERLGERKEKLDKMKGWEKKKNPARSAIWLAIAACFIGGLILFPWNKEGSDDMENEGVRSGVMDIDTMIKEGKYENALKIIDSEIAASDSTLKVMQSETNMDDEETRYEIEAEKQKIKMLKEKRKIIEKKCN